jgi:hypothetical protein
MKIYTRTGDQGQTSLLGGQRVAKDSLRIEAYGTIDELNSHIGLLRDHAQGRRDDLLVPIQETLFSLGSRLASANEEQAEKFKVPVRSLMPGSTPWSVAMDGMEAELPEMRNFILPGGHPRRLTGPCVPHGLSPGRAVDRDLGGQRACTGDRGALPEPPQRPAFRTGPPPRPCGWRGRYPLEAASIGHSSNG